MSILIKGMTMPKNCYECPLFESIYHYHGCHAVPKSFYDIDMWEFVSNYRPSWCPITEVKPHGRLIDADALLQHQWVSSDWNSGGIHEIVVSITDIDDAPTIIESEEEE